VDAVLSYDRLTEAIDGALAAGRADLLETLAERVAAAVLREPRARRAFVRVEKPREGGALGVEIVRTRREDQASAPLPRPVVMALAPDAPRLGPQAAPTILCVGAPGMPLPEAPAGPHARRIAALAVDQAAWALAARWGLHVVSTRTEIDWALRRGLLSVWAPSRLLPGDAEEPGGLDAASLAAWLGLLLDAAEVRGP
jgi:dihydroneopterin aldolase